MATTIATLKKRFKAANRQLDKAEARRDKRDRKWVQAMQRAEELERQYQSADAVYQAAIDKRRRLIDEMKAAGVDVWAEYGIFC